MLCWPLEGQALYSHRTRQSKVPTQKQGSCSFEYFVEYSQNIILKKLPKEKFIRLLNMHLLSTYQVLGTSNTDEEFIDDV